MPRDGNPAVMRYVLISLENREKPQYPLVSPLLMDAAPPLLTRRPKQTVAEIAASLVSARSDELIVGRVLCHPIFDDRGMLLLAEGMTITPEFIRLLRQRKATSIRLHPDDLAKVVYRPCEEQPSPPPLLDEALAKRLDAIIDSGLLFAVNSESALLEQMTYHGSADYHRQEHLDRIERNRTTSVVIDSLMRSALRGNGIDSSEVTRLVASYIIDITGDVDSTIASTVDTICQQRMTDHCVRMSLLGMALGVEMGLDAPNVRNLGVAGLVHDWGMICVPATIREANRWLSSAERYQVGKHPIYTLKLLENLCGLPAVVPLVAYQIHESPNGQGYPNGRTRERIHVMAKILSVSDRYIALVSPRPFRPPLTPYAAMECLLRQAASGDVDPAAVRALLMVQSLFPIGSYVVLSDGSVARVLRRNGEHYRHPIVRIVYDSQGVEVPANSEAAIVDLRSAGLDVMQALPNPMTHAVTLSPEILCMNDGEGIDGGEESSVAEPARESATRTVAPDKRFLSLEDYTENQERRATWALDLLDGAAEAGDGAWSSQRTSQRKAVRAIVSVCVVDVDNPVVSLRSESTFRVLTRDVSGKGLGFVCPHPLPKGRILLGVPVSDERTKWFLSDIVRARKIADTGYWEYGAAFRQQLSLE